MLEVHHFGGCSKTRCKKMVAHVESPVSAVSLLESGEQIYIKSDQQVFGVGCFKWTLAKRGQAVRQLSVGTELYENVMM